MYQLSYFYDGKLFVVTTPKCEALQALRSLLPRRANARLWVKMGSTNWSLLPV